MVNLSETLSYTLEFVANGFKQPPASKSPFDHSINGDMVALSDKSNCMGCKAVTCLTSLGLGSVIFYQAYEKSRKVSGIKKKLLVAGGTLAFTGLTSLSIIKALDLKVFQSDKDGHRNE